MNDFTTAWSGKVKLNSMWVSTSNGLYRWRPDKGWRKVRSDAGKKRK